MVNKLRKWTARYLILGITIASWIPAYAEVNVELTQGVQSAIPVAVTSFEGQAFNAKDPQNLSAVIDSDLNRSGRLKTLAFAHDPQLTDARTKPNDFWHKQGADFVVLGDVNQLTDGRYSVKVRLLNVVNSGSSQAITPNPGKYTILNQQFEVGASQFRGLAHHISDLIYEKITGERGIFATRIAYVSVQRNGNGKNRYTLEVADMDGYNPRPILISTHPIMSPAWSPDGKKLAFVSFEKGRSQIYISEVASGHRQLVTDFPGINGAPSWSPDGKTLAVALSKKEAQPHIYSLNLATGAARQLTSGFAIDTEPAWSPDGNSIIFTSDRGGNPQIYQLVVGTGQIDRVTYDGNYNASAMFSPDGKQIVMLHRAQTDFNIALLDMVSGKIVELTDSGNDESPSMAPNGTMVLYATREGGRGLLGVVSTDGRIKLRLPARDGDVQEPAWSPFLS